MRYSLIGVILALSVGSAGAQTLDPLSDLGAIGSGVADIGSPIGRLPAAIHPADLPLGVPVVCLGACAESVGTLCRMMGYPASAAVPLKGPLGPIDVLAGGACMMKSK